MRTFRLYALTLLAGLTAISETGAATVNCTNSSGDAAAIQSAVSPGGTVTISGSCSFGSGHVNVTRPVVITGNATITALASAHAAFFVYSDNVTFNGLTFVQGGIYAPGANTQKRSNITITNNTFRDFTVFSQFAGVEANTIAANWLISGNRFQNFWKNGFGSNGSTNPRDSDGNTTVAGIVIWGGLDHVEIGWNQFDETENDSMHFFSLGTGANYGGYTATGDWIHNNVFTRQHRMGVEWQDFPNGLSACKGGCNAHAPTATGSVIDRNYFHDPAYPYYGTFPISFATAQDRARIINNTIIIEASVYGNRLYGYPIELSADDTNSLVQGNIVASTVFDHTWPLAIANYPPGSLSNVYANNLFCGYIRTPMISQYGPHTEIANYQHVGSCPGGVGTATTVSGQAQPQPVSSINATFTTPNNQIVSQGSVATFKVNVVSSLSINGVVYYLDGSPFYTQTIQDLNTNFASDRTWLYHASFSTAGLRPGNHTLTAVVYDVSHDVDPNAYVKIGQSFTVN